MKLDTKITSATVFEAVTVFLFASFGAPSAVL